MPSSVSLHVLVVEDDPIIGRMFLEVFELLGHKARLARSGIEALALVHSDEFDLVISDLSMPYMSGRELWQKLQVSHPRLAETMVFISAEQRGAAGCKFLESTNHTYLQKPFDIRALDMVLQGAAAAGARA